MANPLESLAQLSARVRKAKGLPEDVIGVPEDTSGSLTLEGRSLEDQSPAVGAALRNKKILNEMKRNLVLQGIGKGLSTGATSADVESMQADLDQSPYGDKAAGQRAILDQQLQTANDPRVKELQAADLARELKLKTAPAEAQAKGLIDVENVKEAGATQRQREKLSADERLRESLGIGVARPTASSSMEGDGPLPPGAWQPAINADGGVSFSQHQMPAMMQRGYDDLMSAHSKHIEALHEAERLWPGIIAEAKKADKGRAPGFMGSLTNWAKSVTGIGAFKYDDPASRAAFTSESYRYRNKQATPVANFIAKSSYGNIQDMPGLLPGVRGMATIVPLFKEHQTALTSNDPGSPLANVQRTLHLVEAEEDTAKEIRGGSAQGAY